MSSVFISNVDDYISPSQACINPLFTAGSNRMDTNGSISEKKSLNKDNNDNKNDNESSKEDTENDKKRREIMDENDEKQDETMMTALSKQQQQQQQQQQQINVRRRRQRRRQRQVPKMLSIEKEEETPTTKSASQTTVIPIVDDHYGEYMNISMNGVKKNAREKNKKSVSVADCLACSGCVTTAEAILVEQEHSIPNLLKYTDDDNVKMVYTWSASSLADLSRVLSSMQPKKQKMLPADILQESASILPKCLAVSSTHTSSFFSQTSLYQSALEFCHRFQNYNLNNNHNSMAATSYNSIIHTTTNNNNFIRKRTNDDNQQMQSSTTVNSTFQLSTPSIALSNIKTRYLLSSSQSNEGTATGNSDNDSGFDNESTIGVEVEHGLGPDERVLFQKENSHYLLPMLASSCPGVVCFVEKNFSSTTSSQTTTNNDDTNKSSAAIIAHLSTIKSPMSCAGTFWKQQAYSTSSNHNYESIDPTPRTKKKKKIIHVAIMPCHDKKLEAARLDFQQQSSLHNDEKIQDVDLVVTTSEIYNHWKEQANLFCHKNSENIIYQKLQTPEKTEDASCLETNDIATHKWNPSISTEFSNNTIQKIEQVHTINTLKDPNWESQVSSILSTETNDDYHGKINPIVLTSVIPPAKTKSALLTNINHNPTMPTVINTSGGYAEYIFRVAAQKLFGFTIPFDQKLPWVRTITKKRKTRRNLNNRADTKKVPTKLVSKDENNGGDSLHYTDFMTCTLYHIPSLNTYTLEDSATSKEGGTVTSVNQTPVLKFATAYGFKNVQLILQQLRNLHNDSTANTNNNASWNINGYHYIEIMACPLGCLNGGGQIHEQQLPSSKTTINKRETPSEIKHRVYHSQQALNSMHPILNSNQMHQTEDIKGWNIQPHLHTRFHAVPKMELTMGATAGVAVQDTKW